MIEITGPHDRLDVKGGSFSDGDSISGLTQVAGLFITDTLVARVMIIDSFR